MPQPNVVWITVDSIRADHTSVCGYGRETTPNLETIAADGVSFSHCHSQGIWSCESAASILTGTLPSFHGVGGPNEVLPDSIRTVPELLSDVGYRTVGLSANPWFSPARKLDRGFDEFVYLNKSNVLAAGVPTVLRFLAGIGSHSAGLTRRIPAHRSEYLVYELAKQKLTGFENAEDPFFLYVHTQGAHTPYFPPKPYLDRFTDGLEMSPKAAREFVYDAHQNLYREIAAGLDYTPDQWRAFGAMYDALIAYLDDQLWSLFSHLQSLDLGETIFVVTADHGDLLGEVGLLSHKVALHDGLTNVPLVIHGWDDISQQAENLVQHIDVIRTLVAAAGGDTTGLHGVDLRTETRDVVFSQRSDAYYWKTMNEVLEYNPEFDASAYHAGTATSVRSREFKLVAGDDTECLYRLPDEELDRSADYPSERDELRGRIADELRRVGDTQYTGERAAITRDVQEHLDNLGYL
ncbi:sulfatase [Salinigranum rubrum]|uniref:Sulfatase n=1 Tax=Salinigranum rubrum TaxID=755307 RepID=A0A2I8VLR4_9EURY|nr:sulfatase [Salinigranum rubrum]AUV82861.1 sulfatase [Salinigranum rubrum]